jgi:hypothetical protein
VRKPALIIVGILGFLMSVPPPVYAYVDPGTGSYVLQIIIAGVAAASLSLKLFWTKIKSLFSDQAASEEDLSRDDEALARE